jgi:hypothetical protein
MVCEIPYVLLAPCNPVCPLVSVLSLSLSVPLVLCNLGSPLDPAFFSMIRLVPIILVISCLS